MASIQVTLDEVQKALFLEFQDLGAKVRLHNQKAFFFPLFKLLIEGTDPTKKYRVAFYFQNKSSGDNSAKVFVDKEEGELPGLVSFAHVTIADKKNKNPKTCIKLAQKTTYVPVIEVIEVDGSQQKLVATTKLGTAEFTTVNNCPDEIQSWRSEKNPNSRKVAASWETRKSVANRPPAKRRRLESDSESEENGEGDDAVENNNMDVDFGVVQEEAQEQNEEQLIHRDDRDEIFEVDKALDVPARNRSPSRAREQEDSENHEEDVGAEPDAYPDVHFENVQDVPVFNSVERPEEQMEVAETSDLESKNPDYETLKKQLEKLMKKNKKLRKQKKKDKDTIAKQRRHLEEYEESKKRDEMRISQQKNENNGMMGLIKDLKKQKRNLRSLLFKAEKHTYFREYRNLERMLRDEKYRHKKDNDKSEKDLKDAEEEIRSLKQLLPSNK